MVFNPQQAGMALFLLICVFFNIGFISKSASNVHKSRSRNNHTLLNCAILFMALMDVPWVWLCMIQCWNNMLTELNQFHQSYSDDSFGCKFMGFYSTFSLLAMMGTHCLVVEYLSKYLQNEQQQPENSENFGSELKGLVIRCICLFIASVLFGAIPLIEGSGYSLTNGGFCYAQFTNTTQSIIMLMVVMTLLILSTYFWIYKIMIKQADEDGSLKWKVFIFYGYFFITWFLWIPACFVGLIYNKEIDSPYMIIGAIIGHSNALINPILYAFVLQQWINKNQRVKFDDDLL